MNALVLVVFFVSGFAALLYQMIWQRLLAFFGGADVFSVTIIVSAFMAGLGLGSLAGGHIADRLPQRWRLGAFAFAEAAIALFGLLSVWLFYALLYQGLGAVSLSRPVIALVLFLTLLWPTFFMGLSLPLLARALTHAAADSADRIGALYGWNTLGAALGSVTTVFVLVRAVGFDWSVRIGAGLNLLCALAVLAFANRLSGTADEVKTSQGPAAGAAESSGPSTILRWILLYAVSGFVALSLEIVWFRLLGVILKSNSFTFACLLATYLLGVGGGALVGRSWARRTQRADLSFYVLQGLIPVYAIVSVGVLLAVVGRYEWLGALWRHLGDGEVFNLPDATRALQRFVIAGGAVAPYARELVARLLLLYVGLPLFLVGVPTLLMGMSFPMLQRAVQDDVSTLGRRVGWLQAGNIAGSTLGSFLTGLFLLHRLGSMDTLRLLVGCGLLFGWLACRGADRRRVAVRRVLPWGLVGVAAVVVVASPDAAELWARLHGTQSVLYAEDGSGVGILKVEGPRSTGVYICGIRESELPYGGYHTVLGALPVVLHPAPRSVAVIGLGSGDTLFGTGGRSTTERIDLVEIIAPQLTVLKEFDRDRHDTGLSQILRDRRIVYTFGDGREFLMRGGRKFDVVEADALQPGSAYAGNLYSYEYFCLVRDRLNPGGFGVTWSPTPRTLAGFLRAFPHVLAFGDTLVGSNEPIAFDLDALRQRMQEPFTRGWYARAGVDIEALLAPSLLEGPRAYGSDYDRSGLVDFNTDLFPKDEYLVSANFLYRAWRAPQRSSGSPSVISR